MPHALSIEIPIDESVHAGSYVKILAGPTTTGLDDLPISGRVPCRPPAATHPEWLQSRWLEGRWLEGVGSGGWLDGRFLDHAFLGHEDLVKWTGGHAYGPTSGLGTLSISAKIYDQDDRVTATTPPVTTVTINTSPCPAQRLAATTKAGDQITFSFEPSVSIVRNVGGSVTH